MEAFGPEFTPLLAEAKSQEIPIENDVMINGLKNPVYLVIIGFAGLQTLEAARKTHKTILNVLIIEPSLSVFKQTIERNYVGHLAHDELVDLLIGIPPEQMLPHLYRVFTATDRKGSRANRSFTPEIIVDPFVYLDEKGMPHPMVRTITDAVMAAAKQVQLSMGCASDSHFRYEQLIRNKKNLAGAYRIQALFDKFKGQPAVVVGAGPSLKEFIDAYHEHGLKDRALIIACDASLKKLLDHGIKPHLVTRCERKLTEIFHGVKREDTKGIFYVAYPWCDTAFFDLFEQYFIMYRGNGVCKFTDPYSFGDVDGGVSSANAALELAYLFGCKSIFLTGVDLCILDGKTHAEGTQVEFNPENSKSKWRDIRANDGSMVTTIPVWDRCLNEYRAAILKHQALGASVYNTSLRGAQIDGAKAEPWVEAAARIKHHEAITGGPGKIIERYLDKHPQGYGETFEQKLKEGAKFMRQVELDLSKLFASLDDQMLLAKREEEKILGQIKSITEPKEYFEHLNQMKKALAGVYVKCCNEVDQFKKAYYPKDLFLRTLLDINMVDVSSTEHRCASLKNLIDMDHDRLRAYVSLHLNLYRSFHYYAKLLGDLFEKGEPDWKVDLPGDPLLKKATA